MSELFDIQVNAQKEKSIRGSRKLPQSIYIYIYICDENERKKETNKQTNLRRENDTHVKMLLMEGSPLEGAHKELEKTISTSFE